MKVLFESGFIDGDVLTCTGEKMGEMLKKVKMPNFDTQDVIYSCEKPFAPAG